MEVKKYCKIKNYKDQIGVGATFAFGLFMMLYNLMHSDLWGDEWVEYYYSQRGLFDGSMYRAIVSTYQPPLYNFLMHFWLMISKGLIWFRLFNIFLGIALLVFAYDACRRLYGKWVACAAIILLSTAYHWVYVIQECSEYALMLVCLSGMLCFFVRLMEQEEIRLRLLFGFVLCGVAAMYSQYGAAFVVAPLFAVYYFYTLGSKKKKPILTLTLTYGILGVASAVPLYVFYLSKQLGSAASDSDPLSYLTREAGLSFFTTLGEILGYFFGLRNKAPVLWSGVGVVLLVGCVFFLIKKHTTGEGAISKLLLATLLMGYGLHYILTVCHIYAMVHANESIGFYSRYSYFYIPLLVVILPMFFVEITKLVKVGRPRYIITGVSLILVLLVGICSLPGTLANWTKAESREHVAIWMDGGGYASTTYVYGVSYGFKYYVTQKGFRLEDLNIFYDMPSEESLPSDFWIIRSNWGAETTFWDTIAMAEAAGYTCEIIADDDYKGQLAHCYIGTKESLAKELVELYKTMILYGKSTDALAEAELEWEATYGEIETTIADRIIVVLRSDIFQDVYISDSSFVSMLYRLILKTEGDSEGLAYWAGLLEDGAIDREALVRKFYEISLQE